MKKVTLKKKEQDKNFKSLFLHLLKKLPPHPRGKLMIFPAIIVILVMITYPVIYSVFMSFYEWSGGAILSPFYIGWENYKELFRDDRFINSIWHTFYYTGLSVCIEIALGTALALVLNREFRGRGVLRTILLFPVMATPVAISLTWALMFDPSIGVLNFLLELIGLSPSLWVADPKLVIPSLVLVDVWKWTPLVMLIILAGLSALPVEPYESAIIDGASNIQLFRYLTLPLLRPTISVAALFRTIDALKTFDVIYVITKGGPGTSSETLNLYAFYVNLLHSDIGYGCSILVTFFIIIMSISFFLIIVRRAR